MPVDVMDAEWLLSVEQIRSLLEAVRGQEDVNRSAYPFMATVAEQALRPGEARTLRIRDVTLPDNGWGTLTARNSGGRRQIPLHPDFVDFLSRWIGEVGLPQDGLLFPGRRGGQLAPSVYRRLWRQAQEAVLPKDELDWRLGEPIAILRESRLVEWLRQGISPFTVAELAGVNPSWLRVVP